MDVKNLELHISGFFTILEQLRRNLFQIYSHQQIVQELYIKSFNIYQLAQGFLEIISIIDDNHALRLLELLFKSRYPEYPKEAKEYMRNSLISISDVTDPVRLWAGDQDESIKTLVKNEYIHLKNGHVDIQNYSMIVRIDAYGLKSLKFAKEENQPALKYLLNNHWRNCIHKARSGGVLEILWKRDWHHITLHDYSGRWNHCISVADPTIVTLTSPLDNFELPTSPSKVTVLQMLYGVKATSDVQVEAAIYRATTQNGQTMLAQMQKSLENSQIGIKPYKTNPNEADIQVIKDPLAGRATWFIKNIPSTGDEFKLHDILWFNCPKSTSKRITQDVFEGTVTERRGIRFVNSLLPGDRIAITAKSEEKYYIETIATLYTDTK
ncbi:hypothetical protein BDQ17DRAFT_1334173 [Cyathus striatus]|nr:hypothetical protein BDQ17DRAFT_1334173 [Cyathus striatus]